MEITSTDQLKEYLESRGVEYSLLHQLSGGVTNFVWRITYEGDHSIKTLIIKHAEPFVAANSDLLFPVDRMDSEEKILGFLNSFLSMNARVLTPIVSGYDKPNHVLWLSDGGAHTLKEAYTNPTLDVASIGHDLGDWLACLHKTTTTVSLDNDQTAKRMCRVMYDGLDDALNKLGIHPGIGTFVNDAYGGLLQNDDTCVCHGDFWPGNVIVGLQAWPNLTVVDWEMVRRGCGATDVGQFAAEAYLLDRAHGNNRALLPSFLNSYRHSAQPDEAFRVRVIVHMGAHLVFWPSRGRWNFTPEEIKRLARLGVGLMDCAMGKDWNSLRVGSSPVSSLF